MTDLIQDALNKPGEGDAGTQTPKPDAGDLLSGLVGEGKRYKDTNALAQGKTDGDAHIKKLETEGAEMRDVIKKLEETASKGATMAEILEALKSKPGSEGGDTPAITEARLAELIESNLTDRGNKQTLTVNRAECNVALLEHFKGDATKAAEFLKKKQAEVGISPVELDRMAGVTPSAFKQLMGLSDKRTPGQTFTPPGEGGSSVPLDTGGARNAAYYAALKEKVGFNKFYAPKIQSQRFKDMEDLGEDFNK